MPKTKRWRIAYLGFLVSVLFFGFPSVAWAYIDPATTSYIIQIISGLIISLSVAFGVFASRLQMGAVTFKARAEAFWMRMRNKRYRQLYAKAKAREKAKQKELKKQEVREPFLRYLFGEKRSLKLRILIAALLAACLSFSFIFFGILDLLVHNQDAMPYPVTLVFPSVALLSLAMFGIFFVVLAVARGRVYTFLATLVFAAILVAYAQGNFMNGSLGQLTGDWLDLSMIVGEVVVNTIICAAILAVPFLVWRFAPKAHQSMLIFIPSLLIGVQLIALITSFSTSGVLEEEVKPQVFLSEQGLYEVAPENNVIVILLDRLDQEYIDELLMHEPDYFEGHFDGFTRYTNNLSTTSRTFPSVVNMLTGYTYGFDEPADEYMREAWRESEFLPALREQGMRSDIYTDYSYGYLDGEDLRNAADNLDQGLPKLSLRAIDNLVTISLYRYMPYVLKQGFWLSTSDLEADVAHQGEHDKRYWPDDHAVYDSLVEDGLTINNEIEGNFKFIHLNGCHPPFNADIDFNKVSYQDSSQYYQTRFAFGIVFEYLDQLKELGLYEESTIIVLGDHGYTVGLDYLGDFRDLSEAQVTGLFVKLSGEHSTPLATSIAPVNSDQLRATVWQQAGLDYAAMGDTYNQVPLDSTKSRVFMFQVGLSGSQEKYLQYFEVQGDANNFDCWLEAKKEPMLYYHGYKGGD